MREYRLLLLPGDGIGPEVLDAMMRVVGWFGQKGLAYSVDDALIGGVAIDAMGRPDPDETFEKVLSADAVLMGAIGGPKWDDLPFNQRAERALLRIRGDMKVYANLRRILCFDALKDASTLKSEIVAGLDFVIVRELTAGAYFGEPKETTILPDGEKRAVDSCVYTTSEIERVGRVAFELARQRRKKVTSAEKSNVMVTGVLWREVITALHQREFADVELVHLLADNAAMQLVRNPKQFDVLVTDNLFGDVLSDEAAQLTGSIGMLPSASIGAKLANGLPSALYEPVHGSAPDIAGMGVANPIASILSFGMCLQYSFDMENEARQLEQAVSNVLDQGYRTADIMQPGMTKVGTTEMTDAILKELQRLGAGG
jgi:3-isopropylmalate dehydrogenase